MCWKSDGGTAELTSDAKAGLMCLQTLVQSLGGYRQGMGFSSGIEKVEGVRVCSSAEANERLARGVENHRRRGDELSKMLM